MTAEEIAIQLHEEGSCDKDCPYCDPVENEESGESTEAEEV